MMDISLGGLIGAVIGTFIAGVNYHVFIGLLDRNMRERSQSQTAEERDSFEQRMALVRRLILIFDLFAFAACGYWLGQLVEG